MGELHRTQSPLLLRRERGKGKGEEMDYLNLSPISPPARGGDIFKGR